MTIEVDTAGNSAEQINAPDFLIKALGSAGVMAVDSLSTEQKCTFLTAFHLERCNVNVQQLLPDLPMTSNQQERVHKALVLQSIAMRTLAEMLIAGGSLSRPLTVDDVLLERILDA